MLDTNGDIYQRDELLNELVEKNSFSYKKGNCLYQMKDCQLLFIEEIAKLIQYLYMPIKGFKGHNVIDYVAIETYQTRFDRFTYDVLNDQVKNGYENSLKLCLNFGDNEEIALRYNYQSKRLQFLDHDNEIWCGVFRGRFFELGLYIIEKYDDYRDLFC